MRGGYFTGQDFSYGEYDLKQEFGGTHILVKTGPEYTACPMDDPEHEPVRASSPAELAAKLRARP